MPPPGAKAGRVRHNKQLQGAMTPPSHAFTLHPKWGQGGSQYTASIVEDDASERDKEERYQVQRYASTNPATVGNPSYTGMPPPRQRKNSNAKENTQADEARVGKIDLPKPGMKFHIHGSVKPTVPREQQPRRMPPKTDTHLAYGRLSIYCYDRMSNTPIAGCAVCVTTLDRWQGDGKLNSASTFGRATVTTVEGTVVAKVLAGRAYILSATCTGYYPFGKLGERLLANVEEGRTCHLKMAMVPIKVGVIMSAKELLPARLAQKHKYEILARLNEEATENGISQELAGMIQEERVSLRDENNRSFADYVAFSLKADKLLEVRRMGTGERQGQYNTDADGKAFFFGPSYEAVLCHFDQTKKTKGEKSSSSLPMAEHSRNSMPKISSNDPFAPENGEEEELAGIPPVDIKDEASQEKTSLTHLDIGWYTVSLNDATRMIVFAGTRNKDEELDVAVQEGYNQDIPFEVKDPGPTYVPSANRYNVSSSAKAIEYIYTDNTATSFVARGPGSGMYMPIEIYTRLRPKLDLLIFDMLTEEDIGSRDSVEFEVEKIVRTFREVGDEEFQTGVNGSTSPMKTAMQTLVPTASRRQMLDAEQSGAQGWVEVSAVHIYSGALDGSNLRGCRSLKEMYGQPGERYSVTVQAQHPYVEWTQKQTSTTTWDEQPFHFYFQPKVALVVGLRERYSHAPCPGRTVNVEVLEVPPPPVAPPVIMRPGEGALSYALRIIENVVDWVVESHEESAIQHITRHFELETDMDGLVRAEVPPLSLVRVQTIADGDFEDEEMVEDMEISDQAEQFVGFNLESKCFLHTTMYDALTKEQLAGVRVELSLLEDEHQNVMDPPKLIVEDYTNEEGKMETLDLRAGSKVLVKVLEAPFFHLAPRYTSGTDTLVFRISGSHDADMYLPRKPRINLTVFDSTTGEEIMGCKFRVLVDRNLSRASQEVAQLHGSPRDANTEFELRQIDNWGEEMYRCYTGSPDMHRLFIDTQCKVAVQVFPIWPFKATPQMHVQYSGGIKGCAPFIFWLQREPSAAKFWRKRDEVAPDIWDTSGIPVGPPWHPLARLQPIVSSGRVIAPLREELMHLRPGWHPALRAAPGDLLVPGAVPMASPRPLSPLRDADSVLDDIPSPHDSVPAEGVGRGFGGGGMGGVGDGGDEDHNLLSGEERNPVEDLKKRALEHMRMGDPSRLPIEERRLMQLLSMWGCFKHVKGTACKCRGRVNPFTLKNPDPKERRKFVGSGIEVEKSTGKLRLGDQYIDPDQYTASDILRTIAETGRNKSPVRRIMAPGDGDGSDRGEAVYCDNPFFTLWLPDGQGIHVGVHDGLYRDLVMIMEKLKKSIDACDTQLAKIEAYNSTRSIDGAYTFGRDAVDSRRGGVFVVDTSAAMPPNAVNFVARQLSFMCEAWVGDRTNSSQPHMVPLFNCVAAAGDTIAKFSEAPKPVDGRMMSRLPPWFQQYKDGSKVGFNLLKALKMALRLADGKLPIYVVTGGLSKGLAGFTGKEVFELINTDHKTHIAAGESIMPINHISVQPVSLALFQQDLNSDKQEEEEEDKHSMAPGHGAQSVNSISKEAPSSSGAGLGKPKATGDIFMKLLNHISEGRTRLLEIFRQENKQRNGNLSGAELGNLIRRVMPDLSPAQLRYFQVMLDNDGNDKISYRELAETIRISRLAGVAVKARDGLELVDVLRKLAMKQIRENLTVKELFFKLDPARTGFLDGAAVRKTIREIMPAADSQEMEDLTKAFWLMDVNQDQRISRQEFTDALLRGGADYVDVRAIWSGNADNVQEERKKADLAARLTEPGAQETSSRRSRRNVPPVVEPEPLPVGDGAEMDDLLYQISGVTAGLTHVFDMGSAKAAAEYVDLGPIQATRQRLEEEYEKMGLFEKQYGGRVLIEKRERETWRNRRYEETSPLKKSRNKSGRARGTLSAASSKFTARSVTSRRQRPQSVSPSVVSSRRPSAVGLAGAGADLRSSMPEMPPMESSDWRASGGAGGSGVRRPSTAPPKRIPPGAVVARNQAKSPADHRWQVNQDGIAVFTSAEQGSPLRAPADATAIPTSPATPSDTTIRVVDRPERESLQMGQADLFTDTGGLRGKSPVRGSEQPLRSPPAAGGFRDPRIPRTEPQESIYGI